MFNLEILKFENQSNTDENDVTDFFSFSFDSFNEMIDFTKQFYTHFNETDSQIVFRFKEIK